MRLSQSWIIASKDLRVFVKRKNVLYSTILFPLIISILLPLVTNFAGHRNGANGIPGAELLVLLPAFSFFFVILAGFIPTSIAAYSLVGEKIEKSLEPLLATPTTDGEVLLGKSIAALLPTVVAISASSIIFMSLIDVFTHSTLGYYYFPNWTMGTILLLVVPLAATMSVEGSVIISSRINDARAAQQLGGLMILPFAGIYVASELNLVTLDTNDLLLVAGVLIVVDIALFFISTKTFRREEILTRWR